MVYKFDAHVNISIRGIHSVKARKNFDGGAILDYITALVRAKKPENKVGCYQYLQIRLYVYTVLLTSVHKILSSKAHS